jgi:hypothetical protein
VILCLTNGFAYRNSLNSLLSEDEFSLNIKRTKDF